MPSVSQAACALARASEAVAGLRRAQWKNAKGDSGPPPLHARAAGLGTATPSMLPDRCLRHSRETFVEKRKEQKVMWQRGTKWRNVTSNSLMASVEGQVKWASTMKD